MIEAVLALAGLIVPPAFDFVKKKFIKPENDTAEQTAGTLATTSPEVLPGYIDGMAKLIAARVDLFNRDVIGTPSQWVVDLRACIRPLAVVIGFGLLAADMWSGLALDPASRGAIIVNNAAWFGSRLK